MNKPHVHAELIKAWADGAVIQWCIQDGDLPVWTDCADNKPLWLEHVKYRAKPKTLKYRVALLDTYGGRTVGSYEPEQYESVKRSPYFVRWLGEEKEVEI